MSGAKNAATRQGSALVARELPPCPIMQGSDFPTGWATEEVFYDNVLRFTHLVPCNDTRLHQLDPTCWCNPTEDDITADFWLHNSADRRELFETGERKPS